MTLTPESYGFTYLDDNQQPIFGEGTIDRFIKNEGVCLACRLNMAMQTFAFRHRYGFKPVPHLDYSEKLLGEHAGETVPHVRTETGCFAHGWRFRRAIKLTGYETRRHILPQHKGMMK